MVDCQGLVWEHFLLEQRMYDAAERGDWNLWDHLRWRQHEVERLQYMYCTPSVVEFNRRVDEIPPL